MTYKRWKPDEDALLRDLHLEGRTDREIADLLGTTRNRIKARRSLLGLPAVVTARRYPSGLLFDCEDEPIVASHSWSLTRGYAASKSEGKTIYLHRLIARAPDSKVVDHINRNKLDCRRSNLRVVTQRENMANLTAPCRTNNSGYRGVSHCRQTGRFKAYATIGGKQHWLGRFDTPEQAADAAREYRLAYMPGALS